MQTRQVSEITYDVFESDSQYFLPVRACVCVRVCSWIFCDQRSIAQTVNTLYLYGLFWSEF